MERLRLVIVIAAFAATASESAAQLASSSEQRPQNAAAHRGIAVIGDVRNFNTYNVSKTEQTTIRQAAVKAGLLTDSASVSLIRGSQDRSTWTQIISPETSDSGEFVIDGDILVVQSLAATTEPQQMNAALRTNAGVIVVALADDDVAVGDILQQCQFATDSGQSVNIVCRMHGRPPVYNANVYERVVHGDVVELSDRSSSRLSGFGGITPSFSEWQGNSVTQLPEAPAPEVPPFVIGGDESSPDDRIEAAAPLPDVSDSATEVNAADATLDSATQDPFISSDAASGRPGLEVQTVSQGAALPGESHDQAPIPPVEAPLVATQSAPPSEIGLWNLVVIGGLLIAGTLLLAGSFRINEPTESSLNVPVVQQTLPSVPTLSRSEELASPLATVPSLTADISPDTIPSGSTAIPPLEIVPTSAETASNRVAVALPVVSSAPVLRSEWLGGEWLTSKPVISDEPVSVEEHANTDPIPDWLRHTSILKKSVDLTAVSAAVAARAAQSPPEAPVAPAPAAPVKPFADLEDLIHNRLPIDLCATQLPLRIVMYGRPAGPRRLRIDPVHTALAGPHHGMVENRQRESAAPGSKSASTSATSKNADDGFDRVRHSLQERIDS